LTGNAAEMAVAQQSSSRRSRALSRRREQQPPLVPPLMNAEHVVELVGFVIFFEVYPTS